jgi:Ca2+-binding RTX toxin-like protein
MGSESADTLYGSLLVDHIDGGAGNDEIHAGGGNDVVLGGSGDDNLFGDSGNDTLEGGDGNDVLHGGDGSNILRGGAGDDTYVFGEDLVPSVSGDQGGSGQVNLIEDNEGANIISLGDGVNLDGLSFVKTSDSLSSLYFSGQKIEIHGLTSGFTVEVNGLTRSLESFVQVIPAPPVDLRLTPAQQAFLASRETSATLAISQAVLSRRFGAYTDATTSLWEQVNSNETDVGSVALPVWGWVTTEHEGVVGYHDSAGKPLSTNVVSGEYFGALSSVTSFFPLQQALFAQGKNVEVTSISPGTIYAGTDQQEQGGWRHGQVISWVWVGNDKAATPTYGTYTTREYTSHQDAHAANVVLGDADNSLRVGASVVHAGAGNDEISNRGDWIQHTSGIQLLQLLAGVTASFTDGGDGDDTIHGSQLDDVLYGGRGHDVLAGGSGRDQYLVLDYGQSSDDEDLIDDTSVTYIGEGGMLADPGSNDFDVVEFGPGIALEDIYFLRESNPDDVYTPDRIVAVRDGRRLASIVLAPSGYPQQAGIESLEFQDGRVLSMAEAVSISHIAVPLTVGTAPDAEIQEDGTFTYDAGAPFGGGTEAVTYSAKLASGSALPAWLSFDKATGAFTGTLSNEPATTFTVQVTATDKAGATGTVSFSIEVQSVNDAPVTNAIASDQTAFFDQPLLVQLGAELFTDVDVGDTLSWRLQLSDGRPLPSWLSFDATTRTLSGTPADADAGTLNLQVLVVDGANATASQTFQLTVTESDGIDLTGSGRADNLVGTAGDDHIDGLGGADVMTGGSGDDVYVVDNTRDVVKETANHGYDRIESVVSYTLPAEVEALVLKGTRNLSGTGNVLNNRLTGNSGSNRLDGGAGSDTMSGGAGNDVYVVDDVGDQVVEAADEGTDTVIASVSYTLSANVERLTLTGMGLVGTGNDLANLMTASDAGSVLAGLGGNDTLLGGSGADTLLGGDGNDRLDGGAGSDRMEGGAGNDVYLVDDLGDTVAELVGAGTDTVQASVTFTLPSNVENLTLSGSGDIGGTGNDLDNTIVGNASQNVLSGLGGNDRLRGGTGNDTLLGGDGNDRLDGGAGADRLSGGAGNDTYVVDDVGDLVEELANEGTDAVQSSISYVLGSNVENLTLTGLGTLSGTGNELNNVLTASGSGSVLYGLAGNDTLKGAAAHDILFGGEGNDRLDGGESADRLIGGAGDDVYVVDDVGDEVVEESSQGTDSVQAAISYTLVANVENLMLTGNAAINGTGNELANVITGNSASNRLAGLGGNDTLRGGAMADILIGGLGNDRLEGGLGADTYEFGRGDGQDTIVENDDTAGVLDKLHFDAGIAADQLWWRKSGNSLEVSVIGSTDKVTLSNWYLGAARHVEVFELANGSQLLDTQVQALVQAMASFSPPAAGQASLPANYESTLQPVIAANWH